MNMNNALMKDETLVQDTPREKKSTTRNRKFWRFVRSLMIAFFTVSIVWVVIDRFVPVYFTPLMFIRIAQSLSSGEMPKVSKQWVPIDEISPNMVQAVVSSEDNLFLYHHGFSFEDMYKAFEHNQKGKRIHGGSTISQQTAKNVFLWPGRSYVRKAIEAYFTVLIEFFWSKKRIMEVYLNVIETGNGMYGVEAAAMEYFGVHASQLTRNQAAAIAACLPNPRRFDAAHPSSYIRRRIAKISNIMTKIGPIDLDKRPLPLKKTTKRHHRR